MAALPRACSLTGELEHLCGEVLENGSCVDGCGRSDALGGGDARLEVAVHTADGELQAGAGRARLGRLLATRLALAGLAAGLALARLASRFTSARLEVGEGEGEKRKEKSSNADGGRAGHRRRRRRASGRSASCVVPMHMFIH